MSLPGNQIQEHTDVVSLYLKLCNRLIRLEFE